jgi:hypothetical protein
MLSPMTDVRSQGILVLALVDPGGSLLYYFGLTYYISTRRSLTRPMTFRLLLVGDYHLAGACGVVTWGPGQVCDRLAPDPHRQEGV